MTQHLKEAMGCTVDAVELSAEMATAASPWCRKMVVGDVEGLDLDKALDGARYDVILCADVLEHLRDPWTLTSRLAAVAGADARLLLSVPNVAYLGLLVDLLRGNFRYRPEGLLDRSHLRFFTIDSLRELLDAAGWQLWYAEQVTLSLTDSEFRVRLESLTPALRDELLGRPDALCYQWIVEARREPPPRPIEIVRRPPHDLFQVRLFWRAEEGAFDYPRQQLRWARLGAAEENLEFAVPAGQQGLALRLSDRVGFVQLRELSVFDDAGHCLWQWTTAQQISPAAECAGVEFAGKAGLWFVRTTESLIVLNLPPESVAVARRVRVVLDAPVSADYLAARAYWDRDILPARLAACEASRRRLALRRSGDTGSAVAAPSLPVIIHVLPACGGGMERFVRDLCDATLARFNHFVLRVTEASWLLEEVATASYRPLPASGSREVLDALAALQPRWLHLHSSDVAARAAAKRIADATGAHIGVTLHDVLFADADAFSPQAAPDLTSPDPEFRQMLRGAEFVTVPSHFMARLAEEACGVETKLVPNGIEFSPQPGWDDDGDVEIGGRAWHYRVAAVGALGGHKGGARLFDVAAALPEDTVLVVIGFLDGQIEPGWASECHSREADHPGASRIFVTGPYAPEDLPRLLRSYRPQIVYFPGGVPESFSYTLSEAWALGAIPAVPDVGALGERTTAATAVKFDQASDAGVIAAMLAEWSRAGAAVRREQLRSSIGAALPRLVPTIAAMASTFTQLYETLTDRPAMRFDGSAFDGFSALCEMNFDPTQFRVELRNLVEQNKALRATDTERIEWIARLDSSIAELKSHSVELEAVLAAMTERLNGSQGQLAETRQALAAANRELEKERQARTGLEARVHVATMQLGEDEATWIRHGRVVRVARRIPGLVAGLDKLATVLRRR